MSGIEKNFSNKLPSSGKSVICDDVSEDFLLITDKEK